MKYSAFSNYTPLAIYPPYILQSAALARCRSTAQGLNIV